MKMSFRFLLGLLILPFACTIAHAGVDQTASPSQRPMYREISPIAGPRVMYGCDIFLTADFIYWKTRQDGLVYAQNGANTALSPVNDSLRNVLTGRNQDVTFNWDPGFKVGAGLHFWHDGWDVYAQYTWLHTDGKSRLSSKDDGTQTQQILPSTPLPPNLTSSTDFLADSAKSRWKLFFNVIDLELGRNFYVSQFLKIRPHVGFKGTWQRQNWVTQYRVEDFNLQLSDLSTQTIPDAEYRKRDRSNYFGVGFRTGLNLAWHFTNNWSIFGDVAWTAMWSDYSLKRTDRLHEITAPTSDNVDKRTVRSRYDFYAIKYIGEFEVGLRFNVWFYDDRFHFMLQAGWEEQIWINHMTYIYLQDVAPYFDLNLHGLNVKARFDF